MKTIQPGGNIRINDRFFLGGPLTLRGYEMKGVGPRDAGGSIASIHLCHIVHLVQLNLYHTCH